MSRLLVLLIAFLASAVAFVPPMTARSLSAVAAPVTRSHVEMGRGDKRTAKGAPLRSSHASAASSAASATSHFTPLSNAACSSFSSCFSVPSPGKRKAKSFGNARPRNGELRKRAASNTE